MAASEVTARKWKPFYCPYCRVTFEKDWATARFRPYPTFASPYTIRWAACSVCANPIITLEEEAGTAGPAARTSPRSSTSCARRTCCGRRPSAASTP